MGSWIARKFQELGHNVFILDNFAVGTPSNIPEGIDYMSGDAAEISDVRTAFRFCKPRVVYNLAAFAREGTSSLSPDACVRNNITVHMNLVNECIRSPECRKVVYFSSEAVYGAGTPPFDEAAPRAPCDPYGAAKAFCEEYTECMSTVHGFEYTIIRPHNVFGPGQSLRDRGRNVIAIFMNQAMRGEPITVYGDGECKRAFSYIENSIDCYVNALTGHHGEIYNVGDDRVVSIKYLAGLIRDTMASVLNLPPVEIVHLKGRPLEIQDGFATTEKQVQLGYQRHVSLAYGILFMAKWAAKQGPQPWLNIPVELPIEGMPESWR